MANQDDVDPDKRDFVLTTTAFLGLAGVAGACWPLISSMNPTREVQAQSVTDVDLQGIAPGAVKTVAWHGEPVFIFHRTPEEVAAVRKSDGGKDPEPDTARVKQPDWLVVVGICTHLGCVPNKDRQGWLCPCHGSVYDNSGRILSGPAPRNLAVPPYRFVSNDKIVIG